MFCLNEEKLSPILHVICLAMVCSGHQDQAFMSNFSGIPQEHLFNLRQRNSEKIQLWSWLPCRGSQRQSEMWDHLDHLVTCDNQSFAITFFTVAHGSDGSVSIVRRPCGMRQRTAAKLCQESRNKTLSETAGVPNLSMSIQIYQYHSISIYFDPYLSISIQL